MSLHWPYLLWRLDSDRYDRSRTASFDSVIMDYHMRQAFRDKMPRALYSISNAYREFMAAMLIYTLCYIRKGKMQTRCMAFWIVFLKEVAWDGWNYSKGIKDHRVSKKNKVSQADNPSSQRMVVTHKSDDNGHLADAQLLLGLQQSNPPPPCVTLSIHPTPPAIVTGDTFSWTESSHTVPTLSYAANLAQAPAIQPLQHDGQGDRYANSLNAPGSPNTAGESAAQTLLDYWCNTASGDFSGFGGPYPSLLGNETVNGLDWRYWETLVNQIRTGPAVYIRYRYSITVSSRMCTCLLIRVLSKVVCIHFVYPL